MERVQSTYQCTPRICGSSSYVQNYAYDYVGDMTSFTNGGMYALTYNFNAAARLTGVTSNLVDPQHPATIVNNIVYGPFGVSSDSLGNGVNESFGYATRGALSSYSAGSLYSFTLGLASDYNIASANDSANGNWSYGYDQFNRLASASDGSASFTYAYDRFGNRWQQNGSAGPTPQYTFDTNNHGAGNSYDVLGNVLTDGYHSYGYDAENRLISVDGGSTTYVYDAFGNRVAKQSGGVSQWEYLNDLGGETTTVFNGSGQWAYGELYAGGRHIATYSDATTDFLHTDWLGSLRVTSNVSGGNSETCTNLPFGDNRSCSGTDWSWFHFTGLEHDTESNLEHTQFRQLSTVQGRWLSPDPYMGSMDLTNPQSLNRYAYVLNNPLRAIDPLGLYCMWDDMSTDDNPEDGGADYGGCLDQGGTWIDPAGWSATVNDGTLTFGSAAGAPGPGSPAPNSGSFANWGTAIVFVYDYLTGNNASQYYGPNDGYTQNFRKSLSGQAITRDIANNCATMQARTNGGVSTPKAGGRLPYDLFVSPAGAQVGAFDYNWQQNGSSVNVTVNNTTSINSLFYHLPSLINKAGGLLFLAPVGSGMSGSVPVPEQTTSGPMSNKTQTFQWSQPNPCQ